MIKGFHFQFFSRNCILFMFLFTASLCQGKVREKLLQVRVKKQLEQDTIGGGGGNGRVFEAKFSLREWWHWNKAMLYDRVLLHFHAKISRMGKNIPSFGFFASFSLGRQILLDKIRPTFLDDWSQKDCTESFWAKDVLKENQKIRPQRLLRNPLILLSPLAHICSWPLKTS